MTRLEDGFPAFVSSHLATDSGNIVGRVKKVVLGILGTERGEEKMADLMTYNTVVFLCTRDEGLILPSFALVQPR